MAKCEGCGKRATRQDVEGIDLCDACFWECVADNQKDEIARLREIWREYRKYLQEKYPANPGEKWQFSCEHHQKIDAILGTD